MSGAGCFPKDKTPDYTGRCHINDLSGRGGSTRRLHYVVISGQWLVGIIDRIKHPADSEGVQGKVSSPAYFVVGGGLYQEGGSTPS